MCIKNQRQKHFDICECKIENWEKIKNKYKTKTDTKIYEFYHLLRYVLQSIVHLDFLYHLTTISVCLLRSVFIMILWTTFGLRFSCYLSLCVIKSKFYCTQSSHRVDMNWWLNFLGIKSWMVFKNWTQITFELREYLEWISIL